VSLLGSIKPGIPRAGPDVGTRVRRSSRVRTVANEDIVKGYKVDTDTFETIATPTLSKVFASFWIICSKNIAITDWRPKLLDVETRKHLQGFVF
jgi:hypothetical protein